jgi:hypothetical protein
MAKMAFIKSTNKITMEQIRQKRKYIKKEKTVEVTPIKLSDFDKDLLF